MHSVSPSPWPFLMSASLISSAWGFIFWVHYHFVFFMLFGLGGICCVLTLWCRDVIREGTYQGEHTFRHIQTMRLGFTLFIMSEAMFFVGFLWAYVYCSIIPSMYIGCIWPPMGIEPIHPHGLPLLNTIILLTSGVTVTWSHYALTGGNLTESLFSLQVTILLGVLFSIIQFIEYKHATFTMACGIYGTCFFVITGFHGIHVIVGSIFLAVNNYRMYHRQFTVNRHFGFECGIVYWHFVDVVWIVVYFLVYMPFAYELSLVHFNFIIYYL